MKNKTTLLLATIALSLMISPAAFAQSTTVTELGNLRDLVVTDMQAIIPICISILGVSFVFLMVKRFFFRGSKGG